mgnify:CR=1 FL=1
MQVHAVAHCISGGLRCEAQVQAHLPGDLTGNFAHIHRAVCGRDPQRWSASDFELMLAVFGQKHLRLDAASTQSAEQPAAELGALTLGFKRKRRGFGQVCMQVEFVFERGVDLQAQIVAVTLDLIAQQRARAGAEWLAIGFAKIAVDEVQRR